ncbi:hypothetical protein ACFQ9X_45440 [Catenulispora yoronensis]
MAVITGVAVGSQPWTTLPSFGSVDCALVGAEPVLWEEAGGEEGSDRGGVGVAVPDGLLTPFTTTPGPPLVP